MCASTNGGNDRERERAERQRERGKEEKDEERGSRPTRTTKLPIVLALGHIKAWARGAQRVRAVCERDWGTGDEFFTQIAGHTHSPHLLRLIPQINKSFI